MRIKTKKILSTLLFSIMILCCLACAFKMSSVASVKADVSYTVGAALTAEEYNIRGGSIKYSTGNNDNGMRIHVRMAEDYYSSLGSKEAGVLIIPEYNLGDNELAYNTTSVLNVKFIDEDFNPIASPATGESANDKEVLTNLIFRQNGEPVSAKIYNAVFCVRGYVIDGDTIRYTPVWKKAIADVALNFVDDPSQAEHSEELEGYLNTYQVKFFDKDGAQIGDTQNVRYGSTFDVGEPDYTSTQYLEYNKKQSDGTFASDEYDFDAAGATVVKKNMHFKAIVHDRTITYGEGISVKDSSGNSIANGEAVTAGDYTVTYGDSDKNNIITLYQDGAKQGAAADYSVNGASKYVCTVDKASVFTTSAAEYYDGTDKKFTAASTKQSIIDSVNARSQGWDSDGYLYGPDINEFSVTPELRMAYNAVFTTKIAFNAGGYCTGVRIAVGSTECRIMGAPNFSGATRNNFVQIANGVYNGSLTSVNYRLDANISNNEANIKLIFDDTNNKIYVFVSGQDFTDKVTITYQPTEDANYARVQLFNACLTGQAPAKFKDWSVSNGADAVEAELAKEYKTYTTSAVIGDYLGMINVSSNVKNNDDESTIFDAVITGESGFKAGVLFSDFVTNIDIGFYVTENMVYGGAKKSYSITSSLTHRLTLTLRNSGAVLVYVDGTLKTGQYMDGFTNGASRTGTYHCYLDNTAAKSVTFANYHFGNSSSINSSELSYTRNSNGYNVSTDKIARIDLSTAYDGTETMFDAFSLKVKVPNTVLAGVLVKDDTGAYFVLGISENKGVVLTSGQAYTATPFRSKVLSNIDNEYDLLLEFYKNKNIKLFADRSNITYQTINGLGLSTSASYLDIYLVWTYGNTIFGLEGNAIADTAYKTYNSDDLGFTAFSEGYNVSLTKYADIDIVDNGTEDELCSINAHITVPTKTFAGLLVKDNTGAYFAVGFRGDRLTILQSGVAYNGAYYRQFDMSPADDDYDFTLLFTKEHTIKFLTYGTQHSHQGFGSLGLSGSATSVEIYLLWTADDTQFAI